ncbi:MAG: hypothetical protein OXD54_06765 [Candidatus Poribacteria bacterium]|nr:hypothetical protein [Candidatus Poribacteria bacterium]
MAKGPETGALTGKSGRRYVFHFHSLNMALRGFPKFSDVPGIYVFAKENHDNISGNSVYDLLYVGETGSFQDRIIETHSAFKCAENRDCNCIGIYEMPTSSRDEREKVEEDVRNKYKPPCNKTLNDTNPFRKTNPFSE